MNIETLKGVFESLGRERFLEKTESMRLLRTRLDFEQLLYEGIMEALGYERNSKALRELAQHVPFADLDQKSELAIQATLFGVAGLLPSQREKPLPPEVTDDPSIVAFRRVVVCFGICGTAATYDRDALALYWETSELPHLDVLPQ